MKYPQKNKSESSLKAKIEKFVSHAAGSNLSEIQGWLDDDLKIANLHRNLKQEQHVFTLLSPDATKSINSFFHPPKVSINDKEVELSELIKTNTNNGVLIKGRLGQGKSILLKYLHFLEMNMGSTLPIFIELRKIKNPSFILESATDKLINMGLPCSNKLFLFLLTEGYISLFLDGFDELPLDERNEFNQSISDLCSKYQHSKILVTTRPDTEICKNVNFKGFEISLLKIEDISPFILKTLIKQPVLAKEILSKIKKSNEFDFDVLDTPLLLTWFINVYKRRLKIPKTKLGFYEDLFSAILSKHDGFKESYNRAAKSKLSDDEIKTVLCLLCYLIRKAEERTFSLSSIKAHIRTALNACDFKDISSVDYLYDLTHVTCLLKLDGLDYEFIHESVAQYFSACFIKGSSENNAKIFYSGKLNSWKIFEEEFKFLKEIDPIRYTEHFYIPSILSVIKPIKAGGYAVEEAFMRSYIGNTELVCLQTDTDSVNLLKKDLGVLLIPMPNFNYVLNSLKGNKELIKILVMDPTNFLKDTILKSTQLLSEFGFILNNKEGLTYEKEFLAHFGAVSVLKRLKLKHAVEKVMRTSVIKVMSDELNKANLLLEKEKNKGGLFE